MSTPLFAKETYEAHRWWETSLQALSTFLILSPLFC